MLQAPARDVKATWITEIKRVLLSQFHQLKGQTMQSSRAGSVINTPTSNNQRMNLQPSVSVPNGSTPTYSQKYLIVNFSVLAINSFCYKLINSSNQLIILCHLFEFSYLFPHYSHDLLNAKYLGLLRLFYYSKD